MSAPDRLFDDIDRVYDGPRRYTEPVFDYINHSARPEYLKIRKLLEEWFTRYPRKEREELKNRLRSGDGGFYSAFFELYLYNLLFQLGFEIEIHPFKSGKKSRIDFKVSKDKKPVFYLEAKVVMPSKEKISSQVRENQIYDSINKHLESPYFFIGLEILKSSSTSPSGRKISKFLEKKLSLLNYEKVVKKYKQHGLDSLPRWLYEDMDWQIIFFPIPKKPEEKEKTNIRPIGTVLYEGVYLNLAKKIKNAIRDKSTKYGEMDLPYIVAINVWDSNLVCDEEDIELALFGISPPYEVETYKGKLDGVWYGPEGPRNRRISAIWVTVNLDHWRIAQIPPLVWCNPWAEKPLKLDYVTFIKFFDLKDEFVKIGKIDACKLLGLDPKWPC